MTKHVCHVSPNKFDLDMFNLCKCVLSLEVSFIQIGFLNTKHKKKYYKTTFFLAYTFNLCSKSL